MTSDPLGNLWQATCAENPEAPALEGDVAVDLAIVGGGFTGMAAALGAAEAGASVCLIEARDIGHGGSGRNVGLVNAGLWLPPDDIERTLGRQAGECLISELARAPERVYSLIERHAIACEPVRNGTLHCAHSPAGYADLKSRHAQQAVRGAPVTLLDANEARARTGSARVHGALHDARAGTVQPLALCRGLARAALSAGARIHGHTPARSVARDGDLWTIRTDAGTIRSKALLLATNAYHQPFAEVAPPHYVPVHFFQFATAPLSARQLEQVLPEKEGCWDTALVMSSFRLDQAGRLIVGAMGNLDGPGGPVHAAWARRMLGKLYPQLAGVAFEHAWCGRIAMTGDHIPRIVSLGPDALSCYGYSGRGIGPGVTFGTLAAEALLNDDMTLLPVKPVSAHDETFTAAKEIYYETGAIMIHALAARVG